MLMIAVAAASSGCAGGGDEGGPAGGTPTLAPTDSPTPESTLTSTPTAAPTISPFSSPTATLQPTSTAVPPLGFTIHFIDVGQGDATLIVTDTGETLLVDGGRSKTRIRDRLDRLGIDELDAILVTHQDIDHFAGLMAVLEDYDIERIYWNGAPDGSTFDSFMTLSLDEGAEISVIGRGDVVKLGGMEIQVLHPGGLTGDKNIDSIVLLVQCGTVEYLLMGDAEMESEQSMIAAGMLEDVEVLKVGHHGSRTSTSEAFLDVVSPEYAVISAGLNSQYGHPHQETLDVLNSAGVQIFLTDTTEDPDGVTLTTDCSEVLVVEP